jgi:hypothetical protein
MQQLQHRSSAEQKELNPDVRACKQHKRMLMLNFCAPSAPDIRYTRSSFDTISGGAIPFRQWNVAPPNDVIQTRDVPCRLASFFLFTTVAICFSIAIAISAPKIARVPSMSSPAAATAAGRRRSRCVQLIVSQPNVTRTGRKNDRFTIGQC